MAKKEKKELKPEILESDGSNFNINDLKTIAENMEKATITLDEPDNESFFKLLVQTLNDKKNISMKTEYLNVAENYTGTKLEFLSSMGNMPYLKKFVEIFETKRVSLGRKGRQEDVMIIQHRNDEMQQDKLKDFAKMFNVG